MTHISPAVTTATTQKLFPNAAIIRQVGDNTLVFDTPAEAHMHETAVLMVEVQS